MIVSFHLEGEDFIALKGGPHFTSSPVVSFFVSCNTYQKFDEILKNLSEVGTVLMRPGKYTFSEKFGWLEGKYGSSWQLNLADNVQKITPFLMYGGNQYGKAEEAMNFYISLFKNSNNINI